MKTCLITGGGSKFGARLTEQLVAHDYHVYLVTNTPDAWAHTCHVTAMPIDWKKLQLNSIRQCVPQTQQIDLIFFNHNASALSESKFKKSTVQNPHDWQQSYFVSCQFPFYLVHALSDRINPNTKIGWMLSELIVNPVPDQVGYADYIGNKFTNACIMKSFSMNFPACFFGIHPDGGLSNQLDNKARDIVQLIDTKSIADLNGNIFSTQGELLELYEKT
jgi:NAD(P)-dependent dehydrogenase (short-subunit alcohol dehydrogenase family)